MPSEEPAPTILDAPADAALRRFTGYRLKRAYIAIQADFLATLAEFELRATTFFALSLIVEEPDMTQSQLAAALSIERSGVVLIVDELENRDLIIRNKVPEDRRTYALRATLAGVRMQAQAAGKVVAHEDRMLARLTDAQRSGLLKALDLIEAPERIRAKPGKRL
jgi:DNA-binding MarR family transcriptional regulator